MQKSAVPGPAVEQVLPATDDNNRETAAALYKAEVTGLKIAIAGRTAILLPIALIIFFAGRPPGSYAWTAITLLFMLEGLLYYLSIGTAWERRWHKYALFILDAIAIAFVLYNADLIQTDEPPRILIFRGYGPEIFYMLVGTAALTLSPKLVVWTGIAGAASWLGLFTYIVSGMENTLSWGDIPPDASVEELMAILLSPDFIAATNRQIEAAGILLTAILLSFAVYRLRSIVLDRARVERAKNRIEGIFGHYVPTEVVTGLVDGDGRIPTVRRVATLLYLDIARFTTLAERRDAEDLVAILSQFFDRVSQVLSRHGGTVINLNGDAVVAAFNVPIDRPDHADAALRAAAELCAMMDDETFEGEQLSIRIGISSGEVAAGTVGGSGRQTYTVHGDAINLASRLEALNKEYGTRVLISGATAGLLTQDWALDGIGTITVRGKANPVTVLTLPGAAGEATAAAPGG